MLAVYKKELRGYFTSIMGYIVIAFLIAFIGLYFKGNNLDGGSSEFGYTLGSVSIILIIVIPLLTMRTLAEEQKQKTDQLLLSAPISIGSIVTGKFLAVATFFSIPILVCCTIPLVLSRYGNVSLKGTYASILAFWLLGLVMIAVGMVISALTDNQIVAAALGFGINVLIMLMSSIAAMISQSSISSLIGITVIIWVVAFLLYLFIKNAVIAAIPAIIAEAVLIIVYFVKASLLEGALMNFVLGISFYNRFVEFVYGNFDLTSVLYYVTFIGFFLYLTVQIVEKRRWN